MKFLALPPASLTEPATFAFPYLALLAAIKRYFPIRRNDEALNKLIQPAQLLSNAKQVKVLATLEPIGR